MNLTFKGLFTNVVIGVLIPMAFIAGVYYGPNFWMPEDSLRSETTTITDCDDCFLHSESSKYVISVDDFARANREVREFLSIKSKESKYSKMHLRYFVTPESNGYTVHSYTGQKGLDFPEELYSEADSIFQKSLTKNITEQVVAPDA